MKKIMTLIKVTFIAICVSVMFGFASTQVKVSAWTDDPINPDGCATTVCPAGNIYGCYPCPNSSCNGCYRANGDTGCGVCSKGSNEVGYAEVDTSWFSF